FYETYFEKKNARLILATTKASKNLFDFQFNENDFIIFGNESSGAPQEVHQVSDFRVKIFMEAFRSINIATSTGIFLAKARNDINI
ncbi:MAG: TrmH family RNA methyltransferase, partial [Alphaproteobacteria bacterium]